MKTFKIIMIACSLFACQLTVKAQVISNIINQDNGVNSADVPACGSHDYTQKLNQINNDYSILSDQMMSQIQEVVDANANDRDAGDLFIIPVVFHILHNNADENLPDSVIFNQLDILNATFRRRNADTADTRDIFNDIVGDAKIEFVLANQDPTGVATTGIVRTNTSVANFGGILPYGPGQTQQISAWANDSLLPNLFRMTSTADGGSDAWDEERYLNIWIGDLRIFQPQFNNFEELVYFGLATPPDNHVNWPDSVLQELNMLGDGVLMHYVNIGSNNPNVFTGGYAQFNGVTNTGKMLVHEVGHYLGLRHIWGDGDCSVDDFVSDTPNSTVSSSYNCPLFANFCVDDIDGVNLPNMIENYMDYSSGQCQNSFTRGQNGVMRDVLYNYRINLPEVISTVSVSQNFALKPSLIYPNPTSGEVFLDLSNYTEAVLVRVTNVNGQLVFSNVYAEATAKLSLEVPKGLYFVQFIDSNDNVEAFKLMVD